MLAIALAGTLRFFADVVSGIEGPPLERQESVKSCCICCCEFVAGDHLMTLGCGHEFHHECVSRWLRARRFCPMCKAPVGGGGGPMVPMDDDDE